MNTDPRQEEDTGAIATESHSPPHATPKSGRFVSRYVVLTGNPNSGKTTVFNALTGLRARVGNYAGVTVERKEGRFQAAPADLPLTVLDLPGAYSLSPQSLDEQIARDVLFRRLPSVPEPSVVVVVVDASNLERNLYFATQVIELGCPIIIALNMVDVAEKIGHIIDAGKLASALETPVVPMIASTGQGVPELRREIVRVVRAAASRPPPVFCDWPAGFGAELDGLAAMLSQHTGRPPALLQAEALLVLTDEKFLAGAPPLSAGSPRRGGGGAAAAGTSRDGLARRADRGPLRPHRRHPGARRRGGGRAGRDVERPAGPHSDAQGLGHVDLCRRDGGDVFEHLHFCAMADESVERPLHVDRRLVHKAMPDGDLESLLEKGVVLGVGAVVAFLPQICLLFLFIGLLEDTGYMARAAFLMDRLMSKVGLHGKSFIPMLSSFACAIPGIMATRTIETPKDRLVTILVAPLMSCSARLPVYTLLIGACIGGVWIKSLTMLCMYLLGIVVALAMAWLFKKTLLKGETPMLVMELPPYRRPVLKVVLRHTWDRAKLFLQKAGTVILGINILLWFLVSYPSHPEVKRDFAARRAALTASFGQTPGRSRPRRPAPWINWTPTGTAP